MVKGNDILCFVQRVLSFNEVNCTTPARELREAIEVPFVDKAHSKSTRFIVNITKDRPEHIKRADMYIGIEPHARKHTLCEGDDLRVRLRKGTPYKLDSELPELTVSPRLRPLIPEAIAKIIELDWLGGSLELVNI